MGAGKGKARRAKTTTAAHQADTLVDLLMRVEAEYCEEGRRLRDEKFARTVPDIDDLAELAKDKRIRETSLEKLFNFGAADQAELIILRHEYQSYEREWKGHLARCQRCQDAEALQEKVMSA